MAAPAPARASSRPKTGEQDAALYAAVVVPRYASLFSRLVLDALPRVGRGTVLDLGCGTGHPTFELLSRMGDGVRVIAVDHDAGLLDLARRRAFDAIGQRAFFKVESAESLSFGEQVFDVVVANLLLPHVAEPQRVLGEMRRVVASGGLALATTPLAGHFAELFDMFREVSVRLDRPELAEGVARLEARYPTREVLEGALGVAGFSGAEVQASTLRLSYRNADELFRDRLLELVVLPELRGLAPDGEALLADARHALDVYYAGGPLSLTVEAGLAIGRR